MSNVAAPGCVSKLPTDLIGALFDRAPDATRASIPRTTPVQVALDSFSRSCQISGSPERVIAESVMAIEALVGENAPELKRRVCQRAAILLELAGHDPVEVHDWMAHAYNIRSKYVHGDSSTKEFRALARTPMEFASLIQFLTSKLIVACLLTKTPKKDIVKMCDAALLSVLKRAELRSHLSFPEPLIVTHEAPPRGA